MTGSWRKDPGTSINLLQTDGCRTSEHKFVLGTTKGIVGGILGESASEIGLRTKVTGCGETVEREVLALGTFEWIVALVADECNAGTTDARRQRKQTKFRG